MDELDNLKKNAGIQEAPVPSVEVVNDPSLFANSKLPLDGLTPVYMVRDSDVNGLIVSANPITPEVIQNAISQHSNWR